MQYLKAYLDIRRKGTEKIPPEVSARAVALIFKKMITTKSIYFWA